MCVYREKIKNLLKDPQKPTPAISFILGVNPMGGFGGDDFITFGFGFTTGEPATPPSINEPKTLIPAVCQPFLG